jgi:hypothetical protein
MGGVSRNGSSTSVWQWATSALFGLLVGLLGALWLAAQKPSKADVQEMIAIRFEVISERLNGFESLLKRNELAVSEAKREILEQVKERQR